jgi:Zn-dependent peptidase ImmA (M78 family)
VIRRLTTEPSSPKRWADRLVGTLDQEVRDAIARDPRTAIEEHLGLRVVERGALGERGNGGWCDGLSIIDEGVVFFAPTANSKRANFTLCHEVAHYLIGEDDDSETLDWVADLDEPDQVIEQVCDLVASRLLVPEAMVTAVLEDVGLGGRAVAELFDRSEASREVCAIAMSERLSCDGFVALVNRDEDTITFASRAHDGRPYPRRRDPVPAGHPLLRLTDGETAAAEAWWPWPDGSRQPFYQSAFRNGHWVYVVHAVNDLWQVTSFHPAPAERPKATVPERRVSCHCGFTGTARGYPCSICNKISCPRCQECECDRKERIARSHCQRCWQSVPVTQLDEDGYCTGCR